MQYYCISNNVLFWDHRTVGEIFAVSLAQDGPPPNFLMQWCYSYISTGELDQGSITEKEVADPGLMELIKEVAHLNVGKCILNHFMFRFCILL